MKTVYIRQLARAETLSESNRTIFEVNPAFFHDKGQKLSNPKILSLFNKIDIKLIQHISIDNSIEIEIKEFFLWLIELGWSGIELIRLPMSFYSFSAYKITLYLNFRKLILCRVSSHQSKLRILVKYSSLKVIQLQFKRIDHFRKTKLLNSLRKDELQDTNIRIELISEVRRRRHRRSKRKHKSEPAFSLMNLINEIDLALCSNFAFKHEAISSVLEDDFKKMNIKVFKIGMSKILTGKFQNISALKVQEIEILRKAYRILNKLQGNE